MELNQDTIKQIVEQINGSNEETRRFDHDRRHQIYLDGGKKYLIEELRREFDDDGLNELRLAPINFLKKIIQKKSQVYRSAPYRQSTTGSESDNALIEYYVTELALDVNMQKANKYYNLHANTALYCYPNKGVLKLSVVPPMLYSILPKEYDQTKVKMWVFGKFKEADVYLDQNALKPATGVQSYDKNYSNLATPLADMSKAPDTDRTLIFWTDDAHFTTDNEGNIIRLNPEAGEEQFINPIGISPVVHLQKSTDGEPWSVVGGDMPDLQMALAKGWTDVLSIAKHQGFSIMTVTAAEQPQKIKIGINKILYLKQIDGQPTPQVSYLQAQSPLAEYKELLGDLLGLLLATNDISPSTIGGKMAGNITSGFQAMLEQSDAIEAMRSDQPILRDAEKDLWQVISKWHNYMLDVGVLNPDAASLGRFSEDFDIQINYQELKPIETIGERLNTVRQLRAERLVTRRDALKMLHPDMTDDQIEVKLEKIDEEVAERSQLAMNMFNQQQGQPDGQEG